MAATKPHVDEIVGWVDRFFGFAFDGWTHKDLTFRDDYSADFVVRFGNATPRRFLLVSKDAFATLDKIAVYETTESPAMGKSLDGPWYRRLWARLVSRETDAK